MTQLLHTCGQWRLCRGCRHDRAAYNQARFCEGRQEALERHRDLLAPGAVGGRWAERFLTMTLPHSGDIRRDIRVMPKLWVKFRELVTSYLTRELGIAKQRAAFPFVRVIEVTPGADQQGHAHVHAWLLSPFLPHELIRFWWGRALLKWDYPPPMRPIGEILTPELSERRRLQLMRVLVTRRGPKGKLLERVPWPVVDVRAVHGDVEKEFIKYLVKDAERSPDGSLLFMDPALYAEVYKGLEGIRTIQTSKGFWVDDGLEGDVIACSRCGGHDLSTVRKRRAPGDPVASPPERPQRPRQKREWELDPVPVADVLEQMLPEVFGAGHGSPRRRGKS